jgi:gliding motility-associated-like protein
VRRFFLFIGLCFLSGVVHGQYTSRLGRFQVDQIRGCAPFTITITNTNLITTGECTPGKPCIMSFDGSTNCPPNLNCQNIFQFTYTTPGTYKLSVLYQSIGADDITVTVDSNIAPAFDIFTCAGSKVSINITDKTYDTYDIDFDNNGTIDSSIPSGNNQIASFGYGAPGNYNISVKGKKINAANNCSAKILPFTALAVLPLPSISNLTATDAATIQLGFTSQTNIEYHAEIAFNNSSNFQQYQTLYAVNSMTASNLTIDKNYYCFRLSSFDPCANANTYSSPVCSHNFALTIASGTDQLAWQTSGLGIANIQIDRNNGVLTSVSGSTTSYNDNAIVCKTNYCYQLVSKYAGGATSTSLQKCETSYTAVTPPSINNTSSVVSNSNSQVDLVWLQNPAFTARRYDILQSQNKVVYVLKDTTKVNQFTDAAYQEGFCYKINYTDNCDNISAAGLPSCPMVLRGVSDDVNDVILQWTGYQGWVQGVKTYTVQKYNQQGQLLQTFNAGIDSTYTDSQQDAVNQVLYYKITATANQAGVSVSVSNEIRIVKGVNLFYPTAFNPESKASQVNRTFTVKGHFIASMQLQIFDRWGSMVFFSDKNEPWDGRRDGINMPDASYVWTAQGTDLNGSTFKKAGTVVLLRK